MSKYFAVKITFLLLLGLALCELHSLVYILYPETSNKEMNLWLDKSYKQNINVLWYIYELCNILNRIIWVLAFASAARLISDRLFRVLIVFFLYYTTQFCFYVWNRNTVLFSNIFVYIYVILAIIMVFIPEKKTGKVISFDN